MADASEGRVDDLRKRLDGWRAAERREQRLRATEAPIDPAASLIAADELYDLCRDLPASDAVRAREVAAAREAWRIIRARLSSPIPDTRHP